MLGIVDCLPKRGQATVGVLSPTLSVTGTNVTIWLVHLDAGQGKVVRS